MGSGSCTPRANLERGVQTALAQPLRGKRQSCLARPLRGARPAQMRDRSPLFLLSPRPGLPLPKSPPGPPGPGGCGKQAGPPVTPLFSLEDARAHWERPLGRVGPITRILPARSIAATITTALRRKGNASDVATGQSGGIREGQGVERLGVENRKGGESRAS